MHPNEIHLSQAKGMPTALVLLDLSAAFNTINHDTLLSCLSARFGFAGSALKWFRSFFVSLDESRGYLGFSTVTPPPPPQRFPFGRDNLKNNLVRTFKFGMWVDMGNATKAIVL